MAKRKKLNRRLVVFLIIVGVIVAAGIFGYILKKLPKDAGALANLARAAAKAGNHQAAETAWLKAITVEQKPEYYYQAAKEAMAIASQPGTTVAERSAKYGQVRDRLQVALRKDPTYVDAQRMLADLYGPAAGERYIVEATRLLKLVPNDDAVYHKRGLAEEMLAGTIGGKYADQAIADFRKATELKPGEAQYWLDLVQMYRRTKRYDQADKAFAKAIAAVPNNPEIRVAYAVHLQDKGDTEAARQQVLTAIERAPNKSVGYRALAIFYQAKKQTDKALVALMSAKKADPTDYRVYAMIAGLYRMKKQPEKAAQALRDGIEAITRKLVTAGKDELLPGQRAKLEGARLQLHYELANRLLDLIEQDKSRKDKLLPEVQASLKKIRRAKPDSPYTVKIAGLVALAEGDKAKAINLLAKANKSFRGADGQVADKLIRLYFANSPGKAEQIINRYLNMPQHANNPNLLYLRGRLETRYHNYGKAMQFVDKALAIQSDHPEAKALKTELLMLTGQQDTLPKGLVPTGSLLRAVANRASVLWSEGKRPEALKLIAELHTRLPDNLAVAQQLANMYIANKQTDKARALLLDAEKRNPDNEPIKAMIQMLNEPDPAKRLKMRLTLVDKFSPDPKQTAFTKALIYAQFGKRDQYLAQLAAAEKLAPDFPPLVERLFREAINQSDWTKADSLADRAAKNNMDGLGGVLYKVQVLVAQKKYSPAIKLLKAAAKIHPNAKRIETALGECYLRNGQNDEALASFSAAADSDPSYAPALIGMAEVTAALGRQAEHNDWIIKAHRIAPTYPYVQRQYMAIQDATAPLDQSIARRQALLAKQPNDADNMLRLAQLYQRAKQPQKAEGLYLTLWKHPNTNKIKVAEILVGLYKSLGRQTDAQKILNELLDKTDDKVAAYLLWGRFYADSNASAAEKSFQKAIDADPKDGRGYLAMATFLESRQQWQKAVDVMAQYLKLHPDAPLRKYQMITDMIKAGQLEQAEKLVDSALGKDPSNSRSLVLKAMIELERNDQDKALKLLNAAVANDPGAFDALYYRAQIYMRKGLLEEARRDLEQAKQLSPHPRFIMDLASVMLSLGDRPAARQLYREILQQNPNFKPAVHSLLDLYLLERQWQQMEALLANAKTRFVADPAIPMYEARMWLSRKQLDKAIDALARTVKISPDYAPAVKMYLAALIEAGRSEQVATVVQHYQALPWSAGWIRGYIARDLARHGKIDQADAIFIKMLKTADDNVLNELADQLRNAYGATKAAEKLASWIPQAKPDNWKPLYQVANLYLIGGKADQARDYLLKALALAKTDREKGRIQRSIGEAYAQLGTFKKAAAAYREALKTFPNDVKVMNDLAFIYADRTNQAGEAVRLSQKAAAAAPTDGSVVDTYGWSLAKFGKLRAAELQLSRALQLSPSIPDIRYHLGWVYQQKGQLADAESQYKQALKMINGNQSQPLYEVLRKALAQISKSLGTEE